MALLQVASLASNAMFETAMQHLRHARELASRGRLKGEALGALDYQQELTRLERALREDIARSRSE
jgi:hypothetical protein